MTFVLDLAPNPGGVGVFAVVALLLAFLGAAFIAFKLLKKSVKMAFRVAIVAVIIAIGIAGSAFFYVFGTGKPASRTPRSAQTR